MKLVAVLIIAVLGIVQSERVNYNGYKVFEVTPKDLKEAAILKSLHDSGKYDFWSEIRMLEKAVTIMVAPVNLYEFVNTLKQNNVKHKIIIENVEENFDAERKRQMKANKAVGIELHEYNSYPTITDYINQLAKDYPDIVKTEVIGLSTEGRELSIIKISSDGNENKPTIFLDAGIHAREWIAPAVAVNLINQLVENKNNSELIANVNWIILPVFNPDGYEYSIDNDRLWRKTRSPGLLCRGTDGNRNFEFHWMETGASSNECAETFAGKVAFSEPETAAYRDYMLSIKDNVVLYLTLHSYGQYLLYPWGFTTDLPDDAAELNSLGESVNKAIQAVRGTKYEVGSSTNVLYAAAGGSDDWTKGIAGVELAYTIELPGGGWNGFDLPASQIKPVSEETFEGFKVFIKYVEDKFANI